MLVLMAARVQLVIILRIFENNVLRNIIESKRRYNGENYRIWSFMIYTIHQMLHKVEVKQYGIGRVCST
jgi:hypothetical protein